ncbi:MAG: aminoacetone oxidase family FAD-binding enzyme, partial [Oscillospiraceae bacterium]|nr:aminoacetone oxidase family FAD-binding enzyme [Oscillospiraceae bacterium]
MYDLIIIGGGAAGLMAAVTAADLGVSVLLIEKNGRVGKKLLITGKGRCNVTNACGREEFFENIPTNPRFLYSAFSGFSNYDVMDFFEGLGVPLKVERGNRVFPVSDRAGDIVAAFERALSERKERIKLVTGAASTVTEILVDEGKNAVGVMADGREYRAANVLLAAGGASYPGTGSDGGGYKLAKALGHTIVPL